jgi:hypothetical protein
VLALTAQASGLIQIGTYGRGAYEMATSSPSPSPTPTPDNPPATSIIWGRVLLGGNGLSGVTMTLSTSDGSSTSLTDGIGRYSYELLQGGNYTVTPSKPNYSFTPSSLTFNGLGADQADQNFTATGPTPTPTPPFFITGQVKDNGNNPVSGGLITFEIDALAGTRITTTTQTDGSGNYASGNIGGCNQRVKVTPFKMGYGFSPPEIVFLSGRECLTGPATANFTATLQGPTILIEEGTMNRALAVDSVTLLRGPFRVPTNFNFSADRRTRVILFTSDLGLSQPNPSKLAVRAGATSLLVENVGTVTGVSGLVVSYIIVELPNGLPSGDLPLIVTLNGASSRNSPTLAISP